MATPIKLETPPLPRAPYIAPELRQLGEIAALTLGRFGSGADMRGQVMGGGMFFDD